MMEQPQTTELSDRELEILRLVATGASNKEIAFQLSISANTVKVHLRNIFGKIGVASRTEAAMYAVKMGVTGDGDVGDIVSSKNTFFEEQEKPNNNVDTRPKRVKPIWLYVAMLILVAVVVVLLGIWYWLNQDKRANIPQASDGIPTIVTQSVQQMQRLADMPTARYGMAVVAYDGKIYAIAGQSENGPTGVVELYDPVTNTWESKSPKPIPVADINAVAIGGKIFVPGGVMYSGQVTNTLEIYDPVFDLWECGSPMPETLSAFSIATFEGQLYLFGGANGGTISASVYVYTPQLDEWDVLPPMSTPRSWASATQMNDEIHIIGGFDGKRSLNNHEVFQPHGNSQISWGVGIPLPQSRQALSVVSIADFLFALGGTGENVKGFAPLQLVPQGTNWQEMGDWELGSLQKFGTANLGGRVYLLGGTDGEQIFGQVLSEQLMYTIMFPNIP
jgi:DNA-binding CsgD family transcriptional regulator/N-acetylneuraminic acid mutarotase